MYWGARFIRPFRARLNATLIPGALPRASLTRAFGASAPNKSRQDTVLFYSPRMPEKFTWIVFRAHPSRIDAEEDAQPDFFGNFVCPVSRTGAEDLLHELLKNRGLHLIHITNSVLKRGEEDWGVHERLKAEVERQGYGIALTKTVARPTALE